MDEIQVSAEITKITSLIGDRVRTTILWSLLDGGAYTAIELAARAGTSSQNISIHISKLLYGNLLTVEKQGRHKYYRLANDEVASAIESLGSLIPINSSPNSISHQDYPPIKKCRTCYDHMAGLLGVAINSFLVKEQFLQHTKQAYIITPKGTDFFTGFGIDLKSLQSNRRILAKPCLDWSERKDHLAGSLGAEMLKIILRNGWVRKTENSRALLITSKGENVIYNTFKIKI